MHKFYQSICIKLATFYWANVATKVKTLETISNVNVSRGLTSSNCKLNIQWTEHGVKYSVTPVLRPLYSAIASSKLQQILLFTATCLDGYLNFTSLWISYCHFYYIFT